MAVTRIPVDPDTSPSDPHKAFREMMGPMAVDGAVRQAINFCWMLMPPDQRTVDVVEKEVRRVVERALKDLREDRDRFATG